MPSSKSIVLFSANYLPNIGGIERFTEGLALALADLGNSVTIVTNNVFNLEPFELLRDDVQIIRLPCFPLVGGRLPIPRKNKQFNDLLRRLESQPCDGVLINARFYAHTFIGLSFSKKKGLEPIVLDHGSAYLTFGNKYLDIAVRAYENAVTALVKRASPEFYGISGKSVEWLKHFGIDAQGVIPNSIDATAYRGQASMRRFRAELSIPDNRMLIAFTGRLIPEKGIGLLIDMMRLLESEPVDLVVAGDGPLRTQIEAAGLAHVHLVGRLDQPDIAALLKEADLFCLPTRSEGFSTSLLEAAACGTTSLVTDVGGARELMPDGSYGFVEPNADPRAFADVVRHVLDDEVDVCEMGERCRRRVEEQCSWNAVAKSVLGVFE